MDSLLSHHVLGMSWEGFVIEKLASVATNSVDAFFYRTSAGAEIDLILVFPSGTKWAVENKMSLSPKPARGFCFACDDIQPDRKFIVYPGSDRFPIGEEIEVISTMALCQELVSWA